MTLSRVSKIFFLLCLLVLPTQLTGQVAPEDLRILDESVVQGRVRDLNCVGSLIACTTSSRTGTITISEGVLHADFTDDDHTQYPLIFTFTGAVQAGSCTTDREFWHATDTGKIYNCPAGEGDTPEEVFADAPAYTTIQGNSGSATAADGANTLNIVGAGTVNCVAADGSPDSVTCTGTGLTTLHTFRPQQNEPPAANFATLFTRNSHPILQFDAATEQSAVFSEVMNRGYSAGAVTVNVHYTMASAITAEVIFCAQFERIGDSQLDIDADSFHTAVCSAATTVPGTSGHVDIISLAFANQAAIDGIAGGEGFRLKVYRDADDVGDDAAGNAEVRFIEVRQ